MVIWECDELIINMEQGYSLSSINLYSDFQWEMSYSLQEQFLNIQNKHEHYNDAIIAKYGAAWFIEIGIFQG